MKKGAGGGGRGPKFWFNTEPSISLSFCCTWLNVFAPMTSLGVSRSEGGGGGGSNGGSPISSSNLKGRKFQCKYKT